MDIEAMERVLTRWERIDGGWDEETKAECAEAVARCDYSEEWWMAHLAKQPPDLYDRYRRLLTKMREAGIIDEQTEALEIEKIKACSVMRIIENGKLFSAHLNTPKC